MKLTPTLKSTEDQSRKLATNMLTTTKENLKWTDSKADQENHGLMLDLNFWKSSMNSNKPFKPRSIILKKMKSVPALQLLIWSADLNMKLKSTMLNLLSGMLMSLDLKVLLLKMRPTSLNAELKKTTLKLLLNKPELTLKTLPTNTITHVLTLKKKLRS